MPTRRNQTSISIAIYIRNALRKWKEPSDSWDDVIIELMNRAAGFKDKKE